MISRIISLLFPLRCVGCNARGVALCEQCCFSIPFAHDVESDDIFAIYEYGNQIVERVIRDLKYHRRSEAARVLLQRGVPHIAEFIAASLQSTVRERLVLIPIPQHVSKTRLRGFNQSELLAQEISRHIDGAKILHALEKTRPTLPQARLHAKQTRLQNVQLSMKARASLDAAQIYVLVDDVTTTGATFAEAKRALSEAGARKVLCVALAHGYARKR